MSKMGFFKTFFASFLAVLASLVVFLVLCISSLVSLFAEDSAVNVSSNSIIKIDFKSQIADSPEFVAVDAVDFSTFSINSAISLFDVISALEYAMRDDKIKGIYLEFDQPLSLSLAMIEELREALLKFKLSGKFIVSYGEYYSQGAVFLASVSDKIYLNPEGGLDWRGLSMNQLFYKGLLSKIGVEPVVLRSGSYKSAVEPFTRNSMSEQNKQQSERLIGSLWNTLKQDVAVARKISEDELQEYAQNLSVVYPEDAQRLKFVDELAYYDTVVENLNSLVGKKDKSEQPKFISLKKYISSSKQIKNTSKNKIAVVYLDGEIISGKSEQGMVGSQSIVSKLRKVREDENAKALVLRVNSPGGSALASEVIWREVELVKAKMPVIVSMGSVAASGGYYVSVPGDVVLANRMTLTGSIGVFSLLFNAQDALEDKLGVNAQQVKTAVSADLGSVLRAPSAAEIAYGQKQVGRVYETFLNRVSEGRDMELSKLNPLAEGRVFSGLEALDHALVDGVGSLSQAILLAEQKAELCGDFRVWQVVDSQDSFSMLLSSLQVKYALGWQFESLERVKKMIKTNKVWAITPYIYDIQ